MDPIEKPVRIAIFGAEVSTRVRILLPHDEMWHSIVWFKMGKDGSFCFGPSYRPTGASSWQHRGRLGTSFELNADDFTEVTDPKLIKDSHTSIHATGAINMPEERFFRDPLLSVLEQERLCSILFERPEDYQEASPRDHNTLDLKLLYPVDYERPLVGEFYLAPHGKERYVLSRKAPYQVNPIVTFTGFDDGMDRSVQFVLCHLNKSRWPDATYLIIPAGKRTIRERIRRFFVRLTTRWSGRRLRLE